MRTSVAKPLNGDRDNDNMEQMKHISIDTIYCSFQRGREGLFNGD